MLRLHAESDLAVRDAVDSFLAGDPPCRMVGDALFETRNGAYRLRDGALVAARDTALLGARLVGWLLESPGDATVEGTFFPGARAVFVDPEQRRQIIVTSPCLRFELRPGSIVPPASGSSPSQAPPPPRPRTTPPPLPMASRSDASPRTTPPPLPIASSRSDAPPRPRTTPPPLPAHAATARTRSVPPPLPPRAVRASRDSNIPPTLRTPPSIPASPASRPGVPVHRPPRPLAARASNPALASAPVTQRHAAAIPPPPPSAAPFPLSRTIPPRASLGSATL